MRRARFKGRKIHVISSCRSRVPDDAEGVVMETRVDEIGADLYRISIFEPEVAPPAGFTYNHFLVLGDEPLLFHCGRRRMFPLVSGGVGKIIPVDRLRWLTFGHFEADECGSMNEWLAAAQLAHGMVSCRVSVESGRPVNWKVSKGLLWARVGMIAENRGSGVRSGQAGWAQALGFPFDS
jgi:hypothetical protein